MKKQNDLYTLITGASSGLGKELAIECAKNKMNLLLVALAGRNLNSLAEHIAELYQVKVQTFELDLTKDESLHFLVREVQEKYQLNFLINNAGAGGSSGFTTSSVQAIDNIIQLNIRTTSLLTRMMIPALLKQEKSYILNTSSMAAFSPMAFKTVYPASKAFIYSFSLGLREEFRHSKLSVSAVFPGPIFTNSNSARRIIDQGTKGKLGLLQASFIAHTALKGTLSGQAVIIPGIWNKLSYTLLQLLPPLIKSKWLSNIIRKEIQFPPSGLDLQNA